jgi:prevent-host-death family protein
MDTASNAAMDQTISATDANRRFLRLLREVREGQNFMVTIRGKPIARFVSCTEADASREAARAALMRRLTDQPVTNIGRWKRDALHAL